MTKHHGEIIEYTLRKSGYNISDLARELGVNRRTLYNYFKSTFIKRNTILQIGKILRHDFSKEFPELFATGEFETVLETSAFNPQPVQVQDESLVYKAKYLDLLEKYNELLTGLLATA